MNLQDVFTGRCSWRRLTNLVVHLGTPHATRDALGDDSAPWGLQELLLAAVIDQLRAGNWQRAGGKGTKPKPIPRPGVGSATPPPKRLGSHDHDPAEVAAYFNQFAPPPLEDEPVGS